MLDVSIKTEFKTELTAFRAKNKTIASCCYSGKYGTGVRLKI